MMVATDLKTSFQKLKIEVFKLNDRVRVLNMFSGQNQLQDKKSCELFELLMNDVLVSINRLTDANTSHIYETNINGFYSNIYERSPQEQLINEYNTIIHLSRSLGESKVSDLTNENADQRSQAIKQAEEVAGLLKDFTNLLRPHIEYD
jgi:hypothetical protein